MPRRQTRGEYLVGLDFNPSGDANVNKIKKQAAAMADTIYRLRDGAQMGLDRAREDLHDANYTKEVTKAVLELGVERGNEMMRSYSHSLTVLKDAQMNAVAGVTKRLRA